MKLGQNVKFISFNSEKSRGRALKIFFSLVKFISKCLFQFPGRVDVSGKSLSMFIPECSKALAYLWETTPVLGENTLPIYSEDEFKMPAAPWVKEVLF